MTHIAGALTNGMVYSIRNIMLLLLTLEVIDRIQYIRCLSATYDRLIR